MDNNTLIKMELEIMAQKVINMVTVNNSQVEEAIKAGFENAFKNYDFEKAVERIAHNAIETAIRDSAHYGKIKELVSKKAEEMIEKFIDIEWEKRKP